MTQAKRHPLHRVIYLTCFLLSTSILGISLWGHYQIARDLLIKQTMTLTEQHVARSTEALETMIATMDVANEAIIRRITLESLTPQALHDLLDSSVTLNRDIQSIAVLDEEGQVLDFAPSRFQLKMNNQHPILSPDWYQEEAQHDQTLYSKPHIQHLFQGEFPWVISNTIPFTHQGKRCLLLIDYKIKTFQRFFETGGIGKQGYTYLADDQQELIYHPHQALMTAELKQETIPDLGAETTKVQLDKDKHVVLASQVMAGTHWRVVGKTYLQEVLASGLSRILQTSLILFLALTFLINVLTYLLARFIARPIRRLARHMQDFQDLPTGHYETSGYDEANELYQAYHQLLNQVDQLMEQIKLEEAALRKSERNVLEAQIQPHFLYNTLESILWMIESQNTRDASHMVTALGRLLRITLSKGKEYIPLEREFEHVTNYLEIQQIRYNQQFTYQLELPEQVRSYPTIKLILQPIVENAIIHGLANLYEPGLLTIEAKQTEKGILIQIKDNGQGMSVERLEELRRELKQPSDVAGIGLRNVHERLQIYFGPEYGLKIDSQEDQGTCVSLLIPHLDWEDLPA